MTIHRSDLSGCQFPGPLLHPLHPLPYLMLPPSLHVSHLQDFTIRLHSALEDVFKKALRFVRDTKDDKTPFVVLFVNLDGKAGGNDLFHDRARKYWGTEHTEWLALVEPDVKDHDELVEMLEEKYSRKIPSLPLILQFQLITWSDNRHCRR